MEVTQWFDQGEKPVHIGPYERTGPKWGGFKPRFAYWGGEHFGYLADTPEQAIEVWNESNGRKSYHQDYPWRGVTTPAKAG